MLELSFKLCFMLVQSSIICGVISLVLRDEAGFRSFYLKKHITNRQRMLQQVWFPRFKGMKPGFVPFISKTRNSHSISPRMLCKRDCNKRCYIRITKAGVVHFFSVQSMISWAAKGHVVGSPRTGHISYRCWHGICHDYSYM